MIKFAEAMDPYRDVAARRRASQAADVRIDCRFRAGRQNHRLCVTVRQFFFPGLRNDTKTHQHRRSHEGLVVRRAALPKVLRQTMQRIRSRVNLTFSLLWASKLSDRFANCRAILCVGFCFQKGLKIARRGFPVTSRLMDASALKIDDDQTLVAGFPGVV
jgi:hypothetical protein